MGKNLSMRFCFYLNHRETKSGYTTLLITLIRELNRVGRETVLLNYENGLVDRELRKEGLQATIIDISKLNEENASQCLFSTDIFIISRFDECLYFLSNVNPRIIFYDLSDSIDKISKYKLGIQFTSLSRKLILKLEDKKSLFFMDDTGVENIKTSFGFNINNPIYLPLPINIKHSENPYLKKDKRVFAPIRISYIGRSEIWKLKVLEKIIKDCFALSRDIEFYIVVDDRNKFLSIIDLNKYLNKNIQFQILENLSPSDIEAFLISTSDINFGMGTTALHAASLGIPTILVDYSEKDFPEDYSYSWLYDTENYSLGKNILKRKFRKGKTMEDVLNLVQNEKSCAEISTKTFAFVLENYDSKRMVKNLVALAAKSRFRFKDAQSFIVYYYKSHQMLKKMKNSVMNVIK